MQAGSGSPCASRPSADPEGIRVKTLLAALLLFASGAGAIDVLNLQQVLDNAVKNHAAVIRLPKGRVKIQGKLALRNAAGLTIEGTGTTLVFANYNGMAWSFHSCKNIVLRGFTIDFDPLPFVQARITKLSEDGKVYEFEVAKGYPGLRKEDQKSYRQGYIFEPHRRRWKPWVPDLYARKVEIVDERHGRFIMGYTPPGHELVEVGDRIVMTLRMGGAIRMNDCENVRIEDVTFLAAPGAAYLGRYMRGDNYYRYTIRPGPPPPGATEERLISTCADGLNIAYATKGPTIEKCRFSFMGDDSVNFHGVTFAVLAALGERELQVAWPYSTEYLASVIPKGAVVRRLQPGNYAVVGTAKLASFTPLKETTPEQMAAIGKVWPRGKKGRGTVFWMVLEKPLPAKPGDYLDIPASNAPGFVIRDCEFTDHRARGLRIMASHGVIEHNVFRRLKHSAITLGAEYAFWREAGWVEDIVVRNNVIEDVGRDTAMLASKAYSKGAINVFVRRDRGSELPIWPGNRHLVIEGNTIRDCPVAGIRLRGAKDVQIKANRIENVSYKPGKGTDSETPQAIDIGQSENVMVEGTVVSGMGEEPKRE